MADQEQREPEPARDAFERELTTDLKDTTPDPPKGWPLHTRILIGLAVGVRGAGSRSTPPSAATTRA